MKKINISLVFGAILVLLILIMMIISYVYLPYSPNDTNIQERFLSVNFNSEHILGTDNFGRDILSRIMIGSRSVMIVSISSVFIGAVLGITFGSLASISNNIFKNIIMRIIDGFMAFPGILLAMLIVTVVGKGIIGAIIAISIFMIPTFARLTYSMISDIQSNIFIKAAKSYGSSAIQIFFRHYISIMLPKLITQFSSSIGLAIMIETSLSFLGLGIQPPNASWGMMLSEARQFFLMYPYLTIAPGVMIVITVLGFNLIGDGLNDILLERGIN